MSFQNGGSNKGSLVLIRENCKAYYERQIAQWQSDGLNSVGHRFDSGLSFLFFQLYFGG